MNLKPTTRPKKTTTPTNKNVKQEAVSNEVSNFDTKQQKNTSSGTNQTNIYGNDLYQEYLDSITANERAKSESYADKMQSMKYSGDMLKATGYANSGLAQSTQAGISNTYLNAVANANASMQTQQNQIMNESSTNALNNATTALESGMDAQDILNTYGKYMNSQDMDTFNFYVNQANKLKDEEFLSTYGIDEGKEIPLGDIFNYIDKADPSIVSEEQRTKKYDELIELTNKSKYEGYAKDFYGAKLILHNGKWYRITEEVYNQLAEQGKIIYE